MPCSRRASALARIALVLLQARHHEIAPARDRGAARGAAGARRRRRPRRCSARSAAPPWFAARACLLAPAASRSSACRDSPRASSRPPSASAPAASPRRALRASAIGSTISGSVCCGGFGVGCASTISGPGARSCCEAGATGSGASSTITAGDAGDALRLRLGQQQIARHQPDMRGQHDRRGEAPAPELRADVVVRQDQRARRHFASRSSSPTSATLR